MVWELMVNLDIYLDRGWLLSRNGRTFDKNCVQDNKKKRMLPEKA